MLLLRRSSTLAAFSAAAIAIVAACADSDAPATSFPEDGGTLEAGPEVDGGDEDADAGDASVRTCSDQSFCHVALPREETLRDVWGDGTAVVWAVSEEGDVLRWDGQEWSVHTRKLGALHAIWGSGPTDIWIGGANGLYHGTGASSEAIVFEHVDAPGDPMSPILSIWGTGPDDVFAAGGHLDVDWLPHGRVVRRRGPGDAGSDWELDPISAEPYVFKRVFGSATAGTWIVGDDGSDNSQVGAAFVREPGGDDLLPVSIDAELPDEALEQGIATRIHGAGIMADGRLLIVGGTPYTNAFWYGTSEAGTLTWTFEPRRPTDEVGLWAVWSLPGKDTWVAGELGTLRSLPSSGGKWTPASIMITDFPVLEPLHAIWGTAPDDFWVVGRNTAIHRMPRKEP